MNSISSRSERTSRSTRSERTSGSSNALMWAPALRRGGSSIANNSGKVSSDGAPSVVSFAVSEYESDHATFRGRAADEDGEKGGARHSNCCLHCCFTMIIYVRAHWTALLPSGVIFLVLTGASLGLCLAYANGQEARVVRAATDLALDAGRHFHDQLDRATMPLFSLAQFAAELPLFHNLTTEIGPSDQPGSLPYLDETHRNLTGSLCQDPAITERFERVAETIKKNARMQGILMVLELAPHAVVCLLHPRINTEDFPEGVSYNSTASLGLDLLSPRLRWHGEQTLDNGDEEVTIAGPDKLLSCDETGSCHLQVESEIVARLPIRVPGYEMLVPSVGGGVLVNHPYWGFSVAKLNWKELVDRSRVSDNFEKRGFEFLLTRSDTKYNADTEEYDQRMYELAKSPGFVEHSNKHSRKGRVQTPVASFSGEWEMTVTYDSSSPWQVWVMPLLVVMSVCISCLVFKILRQKQEHTNMLGRALAQETKVETERNMTAYFAHELRNPLSAMDSALKAMPDDDLSGPAKELMTGMRICASFMSTIMNNLLDVRKIEEGQLTLKRMPVKLDHLVEGLHRMFLPNVRKGVDFRWRSEMTQKDRMWVIGDSHRLQQIFTNIITNALKYTTSGSVILIVGWEHDDDNVEPIQQHQSKQNRALATLVDASGKLSEVMEHDVEDPPELETQHDDSDSTQGVIDSGGRGKHNGFTNKNDKKNTRRNAPRIRFEVADTGPGILKAHQKQLFKKFVKRGGAPGTGLGLAISKHLTDLMGGEIYFESDPTVKPGSSCIVMLPLPVCQAPQDDEDDESVQKDVKSSKEDSSSSCCNGPSSGPGRDIGSSSTARANPASAASNAEPIEEALSFLVIDDIKMNRMMLKRRFQKGVAPNSTIQEAATGEEALEILMTNTFDVIIVDQYMEDAGGVLLGTDTILAMRRQGVNALVVGCSGNDIDKEFQEAGADYCWQKPLPSNATIIKQVRQHLHKTKKRE